MIGLLVFGGKDRITGTNSYDNAFAFALSRKRNLAAWAAVGAAPLTQKGLESQKVWHTTEDAPQYTVFKQLEEVNHNASCRLLCLQEASKATC